MRKSFFLILAGNLNLGCSYLITTVPYLKRLELHDQLKSMGNFELEKLKVFKEFFAIGGIFCNRVFTPKEDDIYSKTMHLI